MTNASITGVVTWLKGWFFDKDEITTKEQALQTQINNKASTSDLNTTNGNVSALSSGKVDKSNGADQMTDSSAYPRLGTSANATQKTINSAINTKIGQLLDFELVEIVQTLPTASSSTLNKIYMLVDSGASPTDESLYKMYITIDEGNSSFSWELIDDASIKGFLTKTLADGYYAPKSHAVNASTYGLGTTGVYGHVKTINGLTQASHSNGLALSAYQGKVLKDLVDGKANSSHTHSDSEVIINQLVGDYDNLQEYLIDLEAWIDDKSDKSSSVKTIQLVPKTTDATGAIKLIYNDE